MSAPRPPGVVIDQCSGAPKLTDTSYATVAAAWRAGNDAGDGYPYDHAASADSANVLHVSQRDDELDVERRDNDGHIIAISPDGWAIDLGVAE